MKCKIHQFVKIREIDKIIKHAAVGPSTLPERPTPGVRVGCVNCGEIRDIMENGTILTVVPAKE